MCELKSLKGNHSCNSFAGSSSSKQKIVGFYYSDILTVQENKVPTINKEASHIARVLRQHYPNLLVCLVRLSFPCFSSRLAHSFFSIVA